MEIIDKTILARQIFETIPLLMRLFEARMRQFEQPLLPAQIGILKMLSHCSVSQRELAEYMRVSAPTMSATIDALVKRGWITRQSSETDRRVVRIEITSQGKSILDDLDAYAQSTLVVALDPLNKGDLSAISIGIQTLQRAFLASLPVEKNSLCKPDPEKTSTVQE
jgi:DNA-binding MarR family transcriptional regulator